MRYSLRYRWFFQFACLLVMVVLVGCGAPAPSKIQSNPAEQPAAVKAQPTAVKAEPTAVKAQPTATAQIVEKSLELVGDPQFVQMDTLVSVASKFYNPDETMAVEYQKYVISAYDAQGKLLDEIKRSCSLTLPKQEIDEQYQFYLDSEARVDHVEVTLTQAGRGVNVDVPAEPFPVEEMSFSYEYDMTHVDGKIRNTTGKRVYDIEIIAVAYDDKGNMVGGGSNELDVLPEGGIAQFRVSADTMMKPSKIEVSVAMDGAYSLRKLEDNPLRVISTGLKKMAGTQNQFVFFVVENTSPDQVVTGVNVIGAFYNEAGELIGTQIRPLDNIAPGAKAAGSINALVREDEVATKVEIEFSFVRTARIEDLPAFGFEDISFAESSEGEISVTGQLVNPSARKWKKIIVMAIALDSEGNVIGGGGTLVEDTIPANGKLPVEFFAAVTGDVEKVDVYTYVMGDLEDQPAE